MKRKSNAGAKGKYDKETAESIIEIIRAGNFLSVACGAAGIHKGTMHEWMKKYPEFSTAIKKAKHEAQARNVAIIAKAAAKQWQAAAWYLERKHPDKWSAKQRIEHSGRVASGEVEYTDEEARMIAKINIERARRSNGKNKT